MKKIIFILVLILINILVFSIEDNDSWIVMEKGKLSFREGDLGQALRYFTIVIEKEGPNPEADYWIGKIFKAEGEYDLAEKQFLKAIENKNNLFIKNDQINIMYDLSDIYKTKKNFKQYESTLLEILNTDKKKNIKLDENIENTFNKKGINHVVKLYRSDKYSLIKANSELGIFYFESGRNKIAGKYLINSVLAVLSKAIDETRISKPDYIFSELDKYLDIAEKNKALSNYFKENELYKNMYYLALVSYFNENSELTREILKVCLRPEAGIWSKKAEYYYENNDEIKKIVNVELKNN